MVKKCKIYKKYGVSGRPDNQKICSGGWDLAIFLEISPGVVPWGEEGDNAWN